MELPPCPVCQQGRLLPISESGVAYAVWVCSMPDCSYTISSTTTRRYYHKGLAVATEKEKGAKRWTEFDF